MTVTAIYPGTFDPITLGHVDIASRASVMFDHVVVAIGANQNKNPFFSLQERIALARASLADIDNVSVESFDGLLVHYAQRIGSRVVVRGLRAVSDFDYEVQIAGMNHEIAPEIETVFIAAAQNYTFLSSSIVREIARHGGDISRFVHPTVFEAFAAKLD
ncbi:MAG: pantetheine-phosphate adenylyltransferase [Gammaproteobacteria bacterium]|nr:MAG: pantetheine-phosphate adenylyltransferase [Gammaproteobacteria bacterium]PIE37040.1 MAG: pantetheine-phosphate adenylyltransferase [Gammaproteobacteria bacterium]